MYFVNIHSHINCSIHFWGSDGESKKNAETAKDRYEVNQQCRKRYFLQGIVEDIKYTSSAMCAYHGGCILHKNEHSSVRAEFRQA